MEKKCLFSRNSFLDFDNVYIFNNRNIMIKNQGTNTPENIGIELKEIEICIENSVQYIQDKLCLSDILLEKYLPVLINENIYQIKDILKEIGYKLDWRYSDISIKNINNFFIKTIIYQIRCLKKSNPLALLIWAVTLFRISNLLYSNLFKNISDYIQLRWKEIASYLIYENFKVKDIDIYQKSLYSNLVESANSIS